MPLHFYSSNDLEYLLKKSCQDKNKKINSLQETFLPRIILVQSYGMRRWISLKIAEMQGIFANYVFLFPNAFLKFLTENLAAKNKITTPLIIEDPYKKEYLKWRIFQLFMHIKKNKAKSYVELHAYLKKDFAYERCYHLANLLADTYDQYLVYRPELLADWANKVDRQNFQAWLWQQLIKLLGHTHRQARLQAMYQQIEQNKNSLNENYPNITIFGISTLPPYFIALLKNIAKHISIDFYFFNPFTYKSNHVSTHLSEKPHRFIHNLSQEGRELVELFQKDNQANSFFEHHHYSISKNKILLSLLKNYLLVDAHDKTSINYQDAYAILQDYSQKSFGKDSDLSMQIHIAHSPMREVEILQQQLLYLLSEKNYTVNDIIVMAPDIEFYAPYIHAVFQDNTQNQPFIPFQLVDRSLKSENTALADFFILLDFLESSWELSKVIGLLETKSIRKKLNLSTESISKLKTLFEKTGIYWSWDQKKMTPIPSFLEYSWQFGINKLLAHYGILRAFDKELESAYEYDYQLNELETIFGEVVYFLKQVHQIAKEWQLSANLLAWTKRLQQCLHDFFDLSEHPKQEIEMINAIFEKLKSEQKYAEFEEKISFSLLKKHLEFSATSTINDTSFFTGNLTFCSMLPMRSIPFKAIFLLGLSQENFPRKDTLPDFSYLKKSSMIGDRSPRKDDLYIFLETLYSAQEMLSISYVGYDSKTKSELPPSMLITECLQTLDEIFYRTHSYQRGNNPNIQPLDKNKFDNKLIIRHPLHMHNPAYFQMDSSSPNYFPNYSKKKLAISKKILTNNRKIEKLSLHDYFSTNHLKPTIENHHQEISLNDFLKFFQNPPKTFYEKNFGKVNSKSNHYQTRDTEPFRLAEEHLYRYQLSTEILQDINNTPSDVDLKELYQKYKSHPKLPLFYFGEKNFYQLGKEVQTYNHFLSGHRGVTQNVSIHFSLRSLSLPIRYSNRDDNDNDNQVKTFLLNGSLIVDETATEKIIISHRFAKEKIATTFKTWLSLLVLSYQESLLESKVKKSLKAKVIFIDDKSKPNLKEIVLPSNLNLKALLEKMLFYYQEGQAYPLPFLVEVGHDYANEKLKASKKNKSFNQDTTLKYLFHTYVKEKSKSLFNKQAEIYPLVKIFGDLEKDFLTNEKARSQCLTVTEDLMDMFVASITK